jgi:hypothetical protein
LGILFTDTLGKILSQGWELYLPFTTGNGKWFSYPNGKQNSQGNGK